jgi:hypothetical protein
VADAKHNFCNTFGSEQFKLIREERFVEYRNQGFGAIFSYFTQSGGKSSG